MLLTLTLLTLLILLFTLLPLWRCNHWMVRALDFPRVQFVFCAVILLVAQYLLLDQHSTLTTLLIATTLFCLCWQIWWILPYTFLWPVEVNNAEQCADDKQLCILTFNVLMTNRNAMALVDLVNKYKPDLLVTMETDQWWEDQLSVLENDMPYSIKCALDNLYGMHVYSRLALTDSKIEYLVEKDVPSIHTSITLPSSDKIRLHFLHPQPPSPTENSHSTERDVELLLVAGSIADTQSKSPIIVAGDLNDVAWSSTTRLFRKISGLLDPRVGRGIFNTFHAGYPFMRWPLDHLFHSDQFLLREIKRLPSNGSDHFPMLTRLTLSTTPTKNPDGLQANSHERQLAREITDQKSVNSSDVPQPNTK